MYLSNAVEKYCRETGFAHSGRFEKWGPYGFTRDGRLQLEEYYPDALEKTYKGVSGYLYAVENIPYSGFDLKIKDAYAAAEPIQVYSVEYVPDAYEAILHAEEKGLIGILRYGELSDAMHEWIEQTILAEYESAEGHPEYRHFLRGYFPDILKGK